MGERVICAINRKVTISNFLVYRQHKNYLQITLFYIEQQILRF